MQFFGSIILELIGAFFRWAYLAVKHWIKGKKVASFGRIFDGRRNASFQESIEYGVSNIVLGWIIVFAICLILVWVFR
jgi:hypothetical protein